MRTRVAGALPMNPPICSIVASDGCTLRWGSGCSLLRADSQALIIAVWIEASLGYMLGTTTASGRRTGHGHAGGRSSRSKLCTRSARLFPAVPTIAVAAFFETRFGAAVVRIEGCRFG